MKINHVVLHKIIKGKDKDNKFYLDPINEIIKLDSSSAKLLEVRVGEVLRNVTTLKYDTNGVYMQLKDVFKNDYSSEDYLKHLSNISERLVEVQDLRVGSSILFYVDATLYGKDIFLVIKAEFNQAFELDITKEHPNLRLVENSFLGPEKKLYKLILLNEELIENNEVNIYDSNLSEFKLSGLAKYFFSGFLGCKIPEDSKKQVEPFYNYSNRFIRALDVPLKDKASYQNSLITYLYSDTNRSVGIEEFSDYCFGDAEIADDYVQYMNDVRVVKTSIVKDLDYTRSFIDSGKIKWVFDSNVELSFKSYDRSLINIVEEKEDSTILEIQGKVKSL